MSKHLCILGVLILIANLCSCIPPKDERCKGGFYWNEEYHTCFIVVVDDASADGSVGDGSGKVCYEQTHCKNLKASYCLHQAEGQKGYCTIPNCSTTDDNCPDGYGCCDFVFNSPGVPDTFCASNQDLQTQMIPNNLCKNKTN